MNTNATMSADADGFLVGRPGQEDPGDGEPGPMSRVAEDVHAIRKWFEQRRSEGADSGKRPVAAAAPGPKTATVAATPGHKAASSLGSAAAPVMPRGIAAKPGPVVVRVETAKLRDAMGRFMGQKVATPVHKDIQGQQAAVQSGASSAADGVGAARTGRVSNLLGDIKDGIEGIASVGNAGEVDPSVKAAQEVAGIAGAAVNGVKAVGSIAAPIGRGLTGLLPGKANDAPTPWFRRFFGELRGLRREQSAFNKAELRVLKDIEGKPTDGKRGGLMGLIAAIGGAVAAGFAMLGKLPVFSSLGGFLSKLMPAGMLGRALPTMTVPAGAPAGQSKPGLWQRTKARVSGWFGRTSAPGEGLVGPAPEIQGPPKPPGRLAKIARGAGGLLKRLPGLGGLLTVAGLAGSVYASEGDDTKSRAEKDRSTGGAIGGAVGALSGGALGAVMAGPLGAIVGAWLGEKAGDIVGQQVGGWVTDLRSADIPGKVLAGWSIFTSTLGDAFNGVFKRLGLDTLVDKAKQTAADASLAAKRGYAQATGKPLELSEAEANAARRQAAQADPRRIDGGVPGGVPTSAVSAVAEFAGRAVGKVSNALPGRKKFEGFGDDVDAHIVEASKRYGLPEDVLRGFVKMEDGWTGAMSPTGAIGTGQFVKSTWDGLAKTKEGQEIGMRAIGTDFRTPNDPRFDNRTNTLATGLLAKKNADILTKAGLPVTGENLYMLHNIGPGVIPAIKGSNNVTPETLKAMQQNGLKDGMTATDFVRFQKGRYNQAYAEANAPSVLPRQADKEFTPERAAIAQATTKMEGSMAGKSTVTPATVAPPVLVASTAAPVVATATPSVKLPPMPSLPAVSDPPQVPQTGEPASVSGEKKPQVVVVSNKGPVGRDLSDRRAAHIVTGGLAS